MQEVKAKLEENTEMADLVIGGTLILMTSTAIIVGGTLAVGVMTGIGAAMFSGILLFKTKKYKPKFWNTMMEHPLLTDLGLSGFFILTIGSMTATGLIAGITAAGVATVGVDGAVKFIGKVDGIESYKLPKFGKINKPGLAYERTEKTAICEM